MMPPDDYDVDEVFHVVDRVGNANRWRMCVTVYTYEMDEIDHYMVGPQGVFHDDDPAPWLARVALT